MFESVLESVQSVARICLSRNPTPRQRGARIEHPLKSALPHVSPTLWTNYRVSKIFQNRFEYYQDATKIAKYPTETLQILVVYNTNSNTSVNTKRNTRVQNELGQRSC